jgi:hypothetical protein
MSGQSWPNPRGQNLKIKYRIVLVAMGLLFIFGGLGLWQHVGPFALRNSRGQPVFPGGIIRDGSSLFGYAFLAVRKVG